MAAFCLLGLPLRGPAQDLSRNAGYKFKDGIGFYVVMDGVAVPLTWTEDTRLRPTDEAIIQVSSDAEFYAYGLDFSRGSLPGTGPLPPHLLGYSMSYLDANEQRQGHWAARFVPVAGYDQQVYRIMFEGPYDDLMKGKFAYRAWMFELGGNQGYFFHSTGVKYAEEQRKLAAFITQALQSTGRHYPGRMTSRTRQGSDSQPFSLRFTSYDPKSGKVEAEALGWNGQNVTKFEGQLVGPRFLTLKEVNGGAVWDLQLTTQMKLTGVYASGPSSYNLEISLGEPASR